MGWRCITECDQICCKSLIVFRKFLLNSQRKQIGEFISSLTQNDDRMGGYYWKDKTWFGGWKKDYSVDFLCHAKVNAIFLNKTRIKTPVDMVLKHYGDSRSVMNFWFGWETRTLMEWNSEQHCMFYCVNVWLIFCVRLCNGTICWYKSPCNYGRWCEVW